VRRLILFRHAKAVGRVDIGGDLERPLDARGRADAAAAGRWLKSRGFSPDLVLVSPSLRTRETWACVSDIFPLATAEIVEDLYDAETEDLEASLHAWEARADTVMVVAHNPGLQELAVDLLSASGAPAEAVEAVSAGFPTSTVAVFDLDGGGARLDRLFNPRRTFAPPYAETWVDDAGGAADPHL
jgi:phosphohistidine phosphatase